MKIFSQPLGCLRPRSERECRPCPAGWTSQGDKCFLFTQDRADWISSQYQCMAVGGAVATVRTEDEQVNTHLSE